MRLLDAAFDVLRRAGEPLSPAEIVRQIKSARIPIDANEPLDDESVKVELEHVATDGHDDTGIVQTPSGRFTLPSMLDRTIRTGASIATTTASTMNPISIASAIARANLGAMWTLQDATKEVLKHAKRPLSISEMTTMLRAAGVLKGTRSKDEAEVRSQLIQDMLQRGRESAFVRVGNNTYALRYYSADGTKDDEIEGDVGKVTDYQSAVGSLANGSGDSEATVREDMLQETSKPLIRGGLTHAVTTPVRLARNLADETLPGQNREPSQALLRRIRSLSNQRFERFIVVFLASIGMTDVVVINRMRPGELDIHASLSIADITEVRFSIQALNWRRDIHGGDVQLLRGGMRIGDHGLIVTTSDFQRGALEEANRQGAIPIAVINGERLVDLARERGAVKVLGVT